MRKLTNKKMTGKGRSMKKQVNVQRRSQLEYFGKAAAAIAGMSLLPTLSSGAVNFRKASGVQTLYLADDGRVCIGTTTPADALATTKLTVAGDIKTTSGGKVYSAVWNDIADYFEIDNKVEVEFGKVYVTEESGKTRLSKKRCEKNIIGIASDTYGMSVGKKGKDKKEIPIALAGLVLAHLDKVYSRGTALTCTKDGKLTKMRFCEKLFHPERMVAIFYKPENAKKWNGVNVNNRHWVKIK
jgi:hypothetical protein